MVNPFPILNHPIMRTGIFKRNSIIPVLIRIDKKSLNILDKSWAAPLNPLAYTFALIRKKLSDTANKKDPIITTTIRLISIKNIDNPFFLRLNLTNEIWLFIVSHYKALMIA